MLARSDLEVDNAKLDQLTWYFHYGYWHRWHLAAMLFVRNSVGWLMSIMIAICRLSTRSCREANRAAACGALLCVVSCAFLPVQRISAACRVQVSYSSTCTWQLVLNASGFQEASFQAPVHVPPMWHDDTVILPFCSLRRESAVQA